MLTRTLGGASWEAQKFEERRREMDPGPLLAVSLFNNFACKKKVTKKKMRLPRVRQVTFADFQTLRSGGALEALWGRSGDALGMLWGCYWKALGSSWVAAGRFSRNSTPSVRAIQPGF